MLPPRICIDTHRIWPVTKELRIITHNAFMFHDDDFIQ